jgi:hypothetical protein
MHVLLGMEIGIRPQVAIHRTERVSLLAEGFYGILATRGLGSGEGAGVGVRALFRRGGRDGANSLVLAPGVGVLFEFKSDGPVLLAPTLDIAWLKGLGDRCGWETGLEVGIGIAVDGGGNGHSSGEVTPLISGYTGLRF